MNCLLILLVFTLSLIEHLIIVTFQMPLITRDSLVTPIYLCATEACILYSQIGLHFKGFGFDLLYYHFSCLLITLLSTCSLLIWRSIQGSLIIVVSNLASFCNLFHGNSEYWCSFSIVFKFTDYQFICVTLISTSPLLIALLFYS